GKTFWTRFVSVFRSYIVRYSLLGDLPCDISHLQNALDFAFVVINENFVNGKANQAKNLLYNIADLGRSKHKFVHLDSKSFTKDPFYTKDTRDIFREFFGPATEKASYVRVYLLSPVYMRFGRSIVRCLELWKDAPEIDPSDDSYYIPPAPLEPRTDDSPDSPQKGPLLCAAHLEDCNMKYYQQFVVGSPNTPVALDIWGTGDPRRCEPGNPLYNPAAPLLSDWRIGLTCEKFQEFYIYCSTNFVKPEEQCADCRSLAKKARKKLKKKLKKQVMNMESVDGSKITGTSDLDIEVNKSTESRDLAVAKPTQMFKETDTSSHNLCAKHSQINSQTGKDKNGALGSGGDHSCNGSGSQAVAPVNGSSGKRECFTSTAVTFRKQEEITLPCPKRKSSDGKMVFEVMTKSDPVTACKEIRIFVKEIDVSKLAASGETNPRRILGGSQPPPLNADHIRQLVPGLPPGFVWAEGSKWCAAYVDYSAMDASGEKSPTRFILKVFNPNIYVAKESNFALLKYVVQRKRRPSAGWVLGEDDVFTWCQGLRKEDLEQLGMTTFTISTGMGLEDSLLPAEQKTRTRLPGAELSVMSQRAIEKEIQMCNMLTQAWQNSKANEKSVDFIDIDPDDMDYGQPSAADSLAAGLGLGNTVTTFNTGDTAGGDSSSALTKKSAKGKKGKKESKKLAKATTPQAPPVDYTNIDPMTAALHKTIATISGNPPNLNPPKVVNPTELGLPEGCDVIGICARDPDGTSKYLLTARDPYDTKTAQILKDLGYETIDFGLSQYEQPYTPQAPLPVGEQVDMAIKALEAQEAKEAAAKDQGSRPLSVCANCKSREPVPKTYKKCQRCKDEAVIEARYYCGRKCQGEDWLARHREEHKSGTLH
ncbi:hypothetical protein BaRGS_00023658, partial [Batillaria attramentaria]